MNSVKISTNSIAHINQFLIYVLGYKTSPFWKIVAIFLVGTENIFSCTIIQYLSQQFERDGTLLTFSSGR